MPVTLEHVVWPLLLSLARGPDAAFALVGISRMLGGTLTAKHLLPPLLAVLASSGTVRQSWSGGSSALRVSFPVTSNAPKVSCALPVKYLTRDTRCWSHDCGCMRGYLSNCLRCRRAA